MQAGDKEFTGSVPELYDRLMVPLIFEFYANDIARRVSIFQPATVLEIAAGTGVVTRALAASLPATTRIVATDLNPPMLARARSQQPDADRIEWQPADALALPFDDGSFDAVICQFGAMFFPDKVKGYREALRVLKPGGHFAFNVWDKLSENEFPDVIEASLAEFFVSDPPRFMGRTPHGYYDLERIKGELAEAGFHDIAVETIDAVSRAASARDVATAFCQGTPLRMELEARDAAKLEAATAHAEAAVRRHFGSGPVEGRIRGFVFTAAR